VAIDLKNIGGHTAGVATPQVKSAAAVEPNYDPAPAQEKARAIIAYILLAVLVLVAIVMLIAALVLAQACYASTDCKNAKDALAVLTNAVGLVFTPIVGLVGSVIGFYFGAKSASKS
jgi:hypothetical protein